MNVQNAGQSAALNLSNEQLQVLWYNSRSYY